MIALRIVLFVALAFAANAGKDLNLAYRLSECLRTAVIDGVPSLHIPKHTPLRLNRNVSWHGDITVASATLNLTDLVWNGIPAWHASFEQLSGDNDSQAIFPFHLFWNRFVLTSRYTLQTNVALIPGKISGDLNITLDGNYWKGIVNFTKPGFNLTEGINNLDLIWTTEGVDFNFTGLGFLNEPISSSFGSLLSIYFNSGAMKNLLGEALQERLNTVWFEHNERIDALFDFCKNN